MVVLFLSRQTISGSKAAMPVHLEQVLRRHLLRSC